MSSVNTDGKKSFMCSCGIFVNLEDHEHQDWLSRHSAHYAGIKHELKEFRNPTQHDVNSAIMIMAQKLTEGKK